MQEDKRIGRITKRSHSTSGKFPPRKGEDKRKGNKQILSRSEKEFDEQPESLSLKEAVDYVIVIKQAKNLKERTINDYIRNMDYFINWVKENYGDIPVQAVTIHMLREYIMWLSNEKDYYAGHPSKEDYAEGRKGVAASSVNVQIRVIKTFFNEMYNEEIININPSKNLSLMRQETDTVEPLTLDEIRRLLRAPDKTSFAQYRDYVIMILILDTGMRVNEVCSLEKNEINFPKKTIKLPAEKNKNRKSRILPISNETRRLLKKLITESEDYFQSSYVFTTNYGTKLDAKTLQKTMANYGEKARIPKPVSPHVLRHNFATMAANNGMSVFHLMKVMGHADIQTTRKYVQVSDSDLLEQHNMFTPLSRVLKRK